MKERYRQCTTIIGYDTEGEKDILGLWLNGSESKHT